MSRVFSSVHLDIAGTRAGLHECIEAAISNGARGLLILIGSSSSLDLKALPEIFRTLSVQSIAAVFPGVIYNEVSYENGVLVCGMASPLSMFLVKNITRPEQTLKREIRSIIDKKPKASSLMLVIDGLSNGVDNFVTLLHDQIGPDVEVLGAGSGYSDYSSEPNIVTSDGYFTNSALLFFVTMPLVATVCHGWERIDGPFLVNKSSDNLIHQINYQPAIPFYMGLVEQHLGYPINAEDFHKIANHYPFGLEQLDREFLVRDPVQQQGNSMLLAGGVPSNAMVYLLHADHESLVHAAGLAATGLCEKFTSRYATEAGLNVFVIDCISRRMVLAEKFTDELLNIRRNIANDIGMLGVLSIGEIASSNQGGIQWLNKTTVLCGMAK
jgi:hypothetical protein